MQLTYTCAALLGLSSLVASAPTIERELRGMSRAQKREPLAIIQEVQQTDIIVVNQNLEQLAAQQQVIEQEFAALVQAEVALVTQLDTIKNNIRVNHFKARFSQVNTVIVTVQTVVDQRQKNAANRYMVKQLLADNGKPESQMIVMVSEAATMTIQSSAPQTLSGASILSSPTGTPQLAAFDKNAPFGQVGQSIILPAGAKAPSISQVFADPAAIILPNQNNLFVEDSGAFLTDCVQQAAFFQLQGAQIYQSFGQLAQAQSGAVIIVDGSNGGAAAAAPPAAASSAAAVAAPPAAASSAAAVAAPPAATPAAPEATAPAAAAPPAETTPAAAPATTPAEAAPAVATTPAAAPAAPATTAAAAQGGFVTLVPPA
ncbi:hypothetical protein BJ166DRAFT_590025 [Pestalotiopsis sp. NC0098]|nr:hypothetical protein BJ166DRAFT_590025 [Pestalotiopsis sp. NC0098]